MISTDDSKVEQPMTKTLARHPLVLLDQQLKNLAKEDDVPYKDNRPEAHVEGTRFPMRCWKCDGTLMSEEAVDRTGPRFFNTCASTVSVAGTQVTNPDR